MVDRADFMGHISLMNNLFWIRDKIFLMGVEMAVLAIEGWSRGVILE